MELLKAGPNPSVIPGYPSGPNPAASEFPEFTVFGIGLGFPSNLPTSGDFSHTHTGDHPIPAASPSARQHPCPQHRSYRRLPEQSPFADVIYRGPVTGPGTTDLRGLLPTFRFTQQQQRRVQQRCSLIPSLNYVCRKPFNE